MAISRIMNASERISLRAVSVLTVIDGIERVERRRQTVNGQNLSAFCLGLPGRFEVSDCRPRACAGADRQAQHVADP
jgi:hypothetical protein